MINLYGLQERVQERAARCEDARLPSTGIQFHEDRGLELHEPTELGILAHHAEMNDLATTQLAARFNVPWKWSFGEKCPAELRKQIYEWKFTNEPHDELLVRTIYNGDEKATVRGILSKQYRPFDNNEFVDNVVEAFEFKGIDPSEVRVLRPRIGDDLQAHLLIPGIRFDANGRERPPAADGGGSGGIQPAVYLRNSEVGRSKTRINGGTYRGFCENGQIYGWNVTDEFAFIHRGQKHLGLVVNEAIAEALHMSERGAIAYLDKMAEKIEATDLGGIINDWSAKYGIMLESKETWEEMIGTDARRGEISEFDLITDLTYVARATENHDERELLERMAGDMVFAELQPVSRRIA